MSDIALQPTPETDGLIRHWDRCPAHEWQDRLFVHARTLERERDEAIRERDEARAERDKLEDALKIMNKAAYSYHDGLLVEILRKERDALASQVGALREERDKLDLWWHETQTQRDALREALGQAVEVLKAYAVKEESGHMTHYHATSQLPHLIAALGTAASGEGK